MNHGLSDPTVAKIQGVLARYPAVEKAVLYGSRAKGNYKPGSDIDLTLVGSTLSNRVLADIADALDELLLPYSIDLSIFDDLNHADLREHIERVGVVLYTRGGESEEPMNRDTVIQILQAKVPDLLAIYAFGSRVQGTAGSDSDLDLAVLVGGYADPVILFALAGELSDVVGCQVDLVDLRAASTVMQYQIITTGQRWWAADAQAALFEAAILSDKTELDTARAGLLRDIQKEGKIHGR